MSNNYPPGTEHALNAPWNEDNHAYLQCDNPDCPSVEVERWGEIGDGCMDCGREMEVVD